MVGNVARIGEMREAYECRKIWGGKDLIDQDIDGNRQGKIHFQKISQVALSSMALTNYSDTSANEDNSFRNHIR
jgi:hypothetical protein